ncbi:hypothetical protein [Streptomyces griseosporeus]|uniref:hypothetical protein n=1 Tax=Streptomyces griseosporeus TaxID=1910 RepID=UPI0036F4EB3B
MTQHDTPPADRTGLRDRIAAAIHDNRFPDSSWAAQPEVIRADYRSVADAVLAVLPAPADEIKQLREKHKASLRRADEINNALMEEVQRYADGKERPVLWSVYNAMHLRAIEAEAELEKLRRLSPPVDRAALLEIADAIAGIDFHPKARARSLDIAAGLAMRLRRMADEAQPAQPQTGEAQHTDRIVGYVLAGHTDVHCLRCTPANPGDIWTPVTAEELEDGGLCTRCGTDVLIAQPAQP